MFIRASHRSCLAVCTAARAPRTLLAESLRERSHEYLIPEVVELLTPAVSILGGLMSPAMTAGAAS